MIVILNMLFLCLFSADALYYIPSENHLVWSFRFYITLYVVREITEEVDTSFCFEFFDADNIWLKGGSVIVFVFEPESDGFILPVALTLHFVFHQCCREEISW